MKWLSIMLIAVLSGCATGEKGGYIANPDAAISVTETGISGGSGVLIGGDLARCTVAVTGTLPDGLSLSYNGTRCAVLYDRQ